MTCYIHARIKENASLDSRVQLRLSANSLIHLIDYNLLFHLAKKDYRLFHVIVYFLFLIVYYSV